MILMPKNLTEEKMVELLKEQSLSILNAVDHKFARLEVRLTSDFERIEKSIANLSATLDKFFIRLTEHENRFVELNKKVDKISLFIKEKFGVEITA